MPTTASQSASAQAYALSSYPNRAAAYLGKGDFDKGTAELSKAIEVAPDAANVWNYHALVQLTAGRLDEYRKDFAGMLQRFGQTDNPTNAQWTAWTCALSPDGIGDWSKATALAEKAVKSDPKLLQYQTTFGAVLYRAGRFNEAVQRLSEADRLAKEPSEGQPTSPAYAWFFLAMAHHRIGHGDEAKKWLDRAVPWTDKTLHDEKQGTAAVPWNRRLTLKLLREEAEALQKSVPAPRLRQPAEKEKKQAEKAPGKRPGAKEKTRVRTCLFCGRCLWPAVGRGETEADPTRLVRVVKEVEKLYHTREDVADVCSTGFSRNPREEPPKGGTTNSPFLAAQV